MDMISKIVCRFKGHLPSLKKFELDENFMWEDTYRPDVVEKVNSMGLTVMICNRCCRFLEVFPLEEMVKAVMIEIEGE